MISVFTEDDANSSGEGADFKYAALRREIGNTSILLDKW